MKYLNNKNYYETVLCEKKEVKNNCCKGKCAVEKELLNLNEDLKSDKKEIPKFKPNKLSESLLTQRYLLSIHQISTIKYANVISFYEITSCNSLYKPPCNLFV